MSFSGAHAMKKSAPKVAFIGDTNVGKTTLIWNHLGKGSEVEKATTVGSFHADSKDVNGEVVDLQIWDTAGEEQYRSIMPIYIRDSTVVIIVCDISRSVAVWRESVREWVYYTKSIIEEPNIIIVGNKIDKVGNREEMTTIGTALTQGSWNKVVGNVGTDRGRRGGAIQ